MDEELQPCAECIQCGCTDDLGCVDENGEPCLWLVVDYQAGRGVCSACPGAMLVWRWGRTQ